VATGKEPLPVLTAAPALAWGMSLSVRGDSGHPVQAVTVP
jgi:hypothetical protein